MCDRRFDQEGDFVGPIKILKPNKKYGLLYSEVYLIDRQGTAVVVIRYGRIQSECFEVPLKMLPDVKSYSDAYNQAYELIKKSRNLI